MKRRNLLKGLALGGAAAPLWLSCSFGLDRRAEEELCDEFDVDLDFAPSECPPQPVAGSICKSAPVIGDGCVPRPRLVFVIPDDRELRWQRGRVFGELLNHGDDLNLARLALFDIVCATMDQVNAMPEVTRELRGAPWLVLIDTTASPASVVALDDPALGELAAQESRRGDDVEAIIDRRITVLGSLIAAAIEPAMLDRLAKAEAAQLDGQADGALAQELRDVVDFTMSPRLEVVAAAPGSLFKEATRAAKDKDSYDQYLAEERKAAFVPRLADLSRERLTRSRPPEGARWAYSGGCGVRVEGSRSNVAVGCGMGHVPERSRRFLSFLGDHDRGF
ncbi:MAG: hypothetical protein KC486_08330 [Myxococcales bacterium]|nr:hypothetical protein [Myxococcales bacterium]